MLYVHPRYHLQHRPVSVLAGAIFNPEIIGLVFVQSSFRLDAPEVSKKIEGGSIGTASPGVQEVFSHARGINITFSCRVARVEDEKVAGTENMA